MEFKFHYTYRITNIIHKIHYYGSRSTNTHPKEDIGVKYFSSSLNTEFIQDQLKNPDHYKYKIVRVSKYRKLATELEILLHNKFDVAKNPHFYNGSKQTSTGFDRTGVTVLESTKDKIAKTRIGKVATQETKDKLSIMRAGVLNPMFGKTHNEASRKIISSTHLGKQLSTNHKNKIGDFFRGKNLSNEHRQNISNALKGKPKSEDHIESLRQANLGKVAAQETKDKMSKVRKGKQLGLDNPVAKEIIIYDLLGCEVARGAMGATLKSVGLPQNACKYIDSYRVYSDVTNLGLFKRIHNQGRSKFCGYRIVSAR